MTEQEVRDSVDRMISLRARDLELYRTTELTFANPELLTIQRTHVIIEKERLGIEEDLIEQDIYVDTTDPYKTFVWKDTAIWMIRDSKGVWAKAEIVTDQAKRHDI